MQQPQELTATSTTLQDEKLLPEADFNKKTLDSYSLNANAYKKTTPQTIAEHKPEMIEWMDNALNATSKSGVIFEIGSATLRDATYMRSKGFTVVCSDAAEGFIEQMRQEGEQVIKFNLLEDHFSEKYSMIFANGVFPHFNTTELAQALDTITRGLVKSGILAFTIKYGHGDEWITEKFKSQRFTHYWSRDDLINLLNEKKFEVVFENSNKGPETSHNWLNIVCRMSSE